MIRRRARRGFTILEVMLALTLASLVLAAMISVLSVLAGADAVSLKRVEQQTDLAVTQNLIRRTMASLAAAAPMDPATLRESLGRTRAADAAEEETAPDSKDAAAQEQAEVSPLAPPDIAPMFDLYYTDLGDGHAAPVLECVVIDPPGALMPSLPVVTTDTFRTIARGRTHEGARLSRRISQAVRGRFEVAPMVDGRWAMVWRGLDPPSEPVTLIAGVSSVQWMALPIDEKKVQRTPIMSAKLAQDFPISVQLMITTDDGQYYDWMFETDIQVLSMPGDEPEIPQLGDQNDNEDDQANSPDDRDEEDQE